jgi:hypothetical protein
LVDLQMIEIHGTGVKIKNNKRNSVVALKI